MTDERPHYLPALSLSEGLPGTAANISRVAAATSAEASRWAFEQWTLRKKAEGKFALAQEMLFVREALEQATHEGIARYHASLFEEGEPALDATVGIGADLMALAARGPAQGYELDPERAMCAVHNLCVHSLSAEVYVTDCLAQPWNVDAAFADPARRQGGERTLDPERFAPNPLHLAERMRLLRCGALKLSPLLPDPFLEEFGGRLEFVEYEGECREALIVLGREMVPTRSAIRAETGEALGAMEARESQDSLDQFLVEASPSAIRAHCLGQFGLPQLANTNGYLTAQVFSPNPWLKCFPVLWEGRFDVAEIGRRLQSMDATTPEIKQRGAGQDLAKLRKKWIGGGKTKVVVALWSVGKSLRAAILAPEEKNRP